MLEDRIRELAEFFRAHDETRLADWLSAQLDGDPVNLPQRVLAMFRHGMGGLMDPYLGAAEDEHHRLAKALFDEARKDTPHA